jgi:hypothetical protein
MVRLVHAEKNGRLVRVSDVPAGRACGCACPVCRQTVMARKGPVLRHHFAHAGSGGCRGETVLHEVAKRLLAQRIGRCLRQARPLPLAWRCRFCGDAHGGDLLRRARRVLTEAGLGGHRPDVLLAEAGGRAVAAVEIVVSHAPTRAARDACRRAGAAVVVFRVRDGRAVERLERGRELWADDVNVCQRPQCGTCGRRLAARDLYVADGFCWRCERPMKAALLLVDRTGLLGPEGFGPEERREAETAGARIEERVHVRSGARRSVNVCSACGAATGSGYLAEFAPGRRPCTRLGRTLQCVACRGVHRKAAG